MNENDTIATSEIKYGDNDRLAARVAQITGADSLIFFLMLMVFTLKIQKL